MSSIVIVGAVAAIMIVIEQLGFGRKWPRVATWLPRAILLNLVQVGSVYLAGASWDRWMLRVRPWSLDELGLWGGALVGYLAITFIYYWWHRWRHEVDFLWRWFHQVHHSPARIEIITSFYKHPIEIVVNGVLSSMILYWLVGLGLEAASLAVLITGLAELVYHWNVPTPYWMGFVFQRPESHCVHHKAGWHQQNYADLPLWDIAFDTFYNPRKCPVECGFATDAEQRLGEMLRGVDVHAVREVDK